MSDQCKHTRRTGIMSMHRCERKAAKDGYCTRHQHDYWPPKEWAALSDEDRAELLAAGKGPRKALAALAKALGSETP